jgi:cytochrome oxidase Cu insertion factor (SCO1/SenC/PrrC family)
MFSCMALPRPTRPRWRGPVAVRVVVAMLVAVAAVNSSGVSADTLLPADLDPLLRALSVRPWWGDPPRLTLVSLDGLRHSLDPLRGHVVLLYFWATW